MKKYTVQLKLIRLIDSDFISSVLMNKHYLMTDDEAIECAVNVYSSIAHRELEVTKPVLDSLGLGNFKPLAECLTKFLTVPPSNKPPVISYGQFEKGVTVIKMRNKRLYKLNKPLPALINFHILEVTYG